MRYRRLGRTGLQISEIGIGGGALRCATDEYAVGMIRRALELGLNYIDTATAYGDSEAKIGLALKGRRQDAYVATKLDAVTANEARKEFAESLGRLQMDYVDVLSMHGVNSLADLEKRMAPGGVWDAMQEAKREGRTRFLGITGHLHDVLVEALSRDVFDFTLFIMNIVEQDATQELIPLCVRRDIGMTVMKPLATGLLPNRLALRYLLSQPVASVVPGAVRLDWLEDNLSVSDSSDQPLSAAELAEIDRLYRELATVRCRICDKCEPCPQGIRMGYVLGTYRFYDEYRQMGREGTMSYPWGEWSRRRLPDELDRHIASIARCDDCGQCEPRCPHRLPIVQMLRDMMPALEDMKEITSAWRSPSIA